MKALEPAPLLNFTVRRRGGGRMVDLDYDPSSLCGPVDLRVAQFLEEDRGNKLDSEYVRHVHKWHGGIPGEQYSEAEEEQDLPRWPVSPAQT